MIRKTAPCADPEGGGAVGGMFTLQRLLVAILAAVAGASLYAQTDWLEAAKSARQLPTETFIGSPDVRQPRLSPDGSKIALLFPHEGKMALGLFDRKKGQPR